MNQALAPSSKIATKQAIHRTADGLQTVVDLGQLERNFRSCSGHYVVFRNIAPLDNNPWDWTLTDSPVEGEPIYKGNFRLWSAHPSTDDLAAEPVYKHASENGVSEYSQTLETTFGEPVETTVFRSGD
jgi:hypothetical protein